jgi:hypothetical protein
MISESEIKLEKNQEEMLMNKRFVNSWYMNIYINYIGCIKKRRNSEQETSTQEKFKSLIACQMRGQSQEQCVQDFQHVS